MQRKRGRKRNRRTPGSGMPLVAVDDVVKDEFREIARTQSRPTPLAKTKASMEQETITIIPPLHATILRSSGNCQTMTENRIKEAINRIPINAIGMPIPVRRGSCQIRRPSQKCSRNAAEPSAMPRAAAVSRWGNRRTVPTRPAHAATAIRTERWCSFRQRSEVSTEIVMAWPPISGSGPWRARRQGENRPPRARPPEGTCRAAIRPRSSRRRWP